MKENGAKKNMKKILTCFFTQGSKSNYLLVIRQYNIEHHFPMIVLDLDSFALLGSQVGVEDEVDEEKFQA